MFCSTTIIVPEWFQEWYIAHEHRTNHRHEGIVFFWNSSFHINNVIIKKFTATSEEGLILNAVSKWSNASYKFISKRKQFKKSQKKTTIFLNKIHANDCHESIYRQISCEWTRHSTDRWRARRWAAPAPLRFDSRRRRGLLSTVWLQYTSIASAMPIIAYKWLI